jgi:hypothetical protein
LDADERRLTGFYKEKKRKIFKLDTLGSDLLKAFKDSRYFSNSRYFNFFKYVQKMKDTGITVVSGIYRMDDYVTRQEMAAFLGRAFLGMM